MSVTYLLNLRDSLINVCLFPEGMQLFEAGGDVVRSRLGLRHRYQLLFPLPHLGGRAPAPAPVALPGGRGRLDGKEESATTGFQTGKAAGVGPELGWVTTPLAPTAEVPVVLQELLPLQVTLQIICSC